VTVADSEFGLCASIPTVWQSAVASFHAPTSPPMPAVRQGNTHQYHPPVMHPPPASHAPSFLHPTSVQPPSVHPRYTTPPREGHWEQHPAPHSTGYSPFSSGSFESAHHSASPAAFESHRFSPGSAFQRQLSASSSTSGYEAPSGVTSQKVASGSFDSTKYMVPMKPTYVVPVTLTSLNYTGMPSAGKTPSSLAYQGSGADAGSTGMFGK